MEEDDDATLLRAWTQSRDEEAFRQLVSRYAGLVFGAARRRSGSEDLAAEAAQDVFIRLAQRAESIRKAEALPGWLHATAVRAASDRLRGESRYRAYMKLFSNESVALSKTEPDERAWKEALPHLDEAISRLSEPDRGILLARFGQGESVAETARRFGLSPAATQKRGERALVKVEGLLKRRGVTLSVALLGSGLGGQLAPAAPVAMQGKWCMAALNGGKSGAASGWLGLLSERSVSIVAALVGASVPVGLQLSANAKARGAMATSAVPGSASKFTPAAVTGSSAGTMRPVVNGLDLNVLAREIRAFPPKQGRFQKELELRAVMQSLDAAQCPAVAKIVAEAPSLVQMSDIVSELFSRWEEVDREGALAQAEEMKGPPLDALAQTAILTAWAEKNPQGMLARFSPNLGKPGIGELAGTACAQALRTWAEKDPDAAMQAAMAIPVKTDGPASPVQAALTGWASTDPDAAAKWFENKATPAEKEPYYKDAYYLKFVRDLRILKPDKAWNSLQHWPDRELADHEAAATLESWAANDPLSAAAAWREAPATWRTKVFAEELGMGIGFADPSLKEAIADGIIEKVLRDAFVKAVEERVERTRELRSE